MTILTEVLADAKRSSICPPPHGDNVAHGTEIRQTKETIWLKPGCFHAFFLPILLAAAGPGRD